MLTERTEALGLPMAGDAKVSLEARADIAYDALIARILSFAEK